MIDIEQFKTIPDAFFEAVRLYADHPFLAVPANAARAYSPAGTEISYREAGAGVRKLTDSYRAAGYGVGHRIGLLIENRPEHLLHKLAINAIGACCVPLNADSRLAELAFVIDHAKIDLVIVVEQTQGLVRRVVEETQVKPQIVRLEDAQSDNKLNNRALLPSPKHPAPQVRLARGHESSHIVGTV